MWFAIEFSNNLNILIMKTNMQIRAIGCMAIALSSICYVSCTKDNSTSPSSGTAQYNMYMTDAPAGYQQVNVDIIGAQVNSATAGWVGLNIHPGIYNLLTLTNGKDTLLATGMVAVGGVSQVRLILGEDNTVMVNNTLYPLQTPSAEQSGLKLNINGTLVAGTVYNVTLDFDAGMSVVQTGNGSYILKPVIRALISPDNGVIKGIISPANSVTAIVAVSESSDSTSSYSSAISGDFMVNTLPTGSYKVIIMPQPPYAIQTFTSVAVVSGQVTDMGTITLQ